MPMFSLGKSKFLQGVVVENGPLSVSLVFPVFSLFQLDDEFLITSADQVTINGNGLTCSQCCVERWFLFIFYTNKNPAAKHIPGSLWSNVIALW